MLLLHFTAVFIYENPFSDHNRRTDYWAQAYVYPYFHQTWNLFAPPPEINFSLVVQYKGSKGLISRSDLLTEIISHHQANRLAGYEPLLLAFINSLHYVEARNPVKGADYVLIPGNTDFEILKRTAVNYLKLTRGDSVRDATLTILAQHVKGGRLAVFQEAGK